MTYRVSLLGSSQVARFLALALLAASCEKTHSSEVRGVSTSGDDKSSTEVKMSVDEDGPPNPSCETFCKRLAQCWYAVPNADPMLSAAQVMARCHSEQHDCRGDTTTTHCCAVKTDCHDFVQCYGAANDAPSACGAETAP
ncbi:MAG TPA: hypothetical protein VH142_21715 [Polyangiaceae bacterium]|jgi:hypothetical protein|nr:hypothetical protein [Polyangiaceae bacterium]